jgi:type II secretory pathway pseudopilin PulG
MLTPLRGQRGFTLIELLVSSVVTIIVLGSAVALASQIQNGYRRQMEEAVAEQEGRYALDWISRYIRAADNDPYAAPTSNCPVAGTVFDGIQFDPDADGFQNDIRIQTDANPPDGQIGGEAGACDQAFEDVTISLDAANDTIIFFDNNLDAAGTTRTDNVIEDLRFVYYKGDHSDLDPLVDLAADVRYVETQITIRTRTIDPSTGLPVTRTLSSEVRVRSRP